MKILVLFILFLIIESTLLCQEFENYVSVTTKNLEKEDFSFLDGKTDGYDLVVIGEEHFRKGNIEFQLGLFKYLYKSRGVRHILIEYGESRAILINQYFRTGDLKILRETSMEKSDLQFYYQLKLFYDILPDSEKFKIHGIDYEKEGVEKIELAILKIMHAISLKNDKILSNNSLNFIKNRGKDYFNGEALSNIMTFLLEIKKDTVKYKLEFGPYYEDLLSLFCALEVDVKKVRYKEKTFHPLREKRELLIYNQIINLKKRYEGDVLYCITGSNHISLNSHEKWATFIDFNSFVSKLNTLEASPFKSKVFSILPLYKSCIPPWKKNYSKKNIGLIRSQIKELDEKSRGNIFTLFECPNETEEQKKYWEGYYQMILVNRF